MKKNRLYFREHRCWLELDEESYLQIRRERERVRYWKQKANECYCSRKKLWLCDGFCDTCEFYCPRIRSLDEPIDSCGEIILMETLSDGCDYEIRTLSVCESRKKLSIVCEQMPMLLIYGELKQEGYTDTEIAKRLNITRSSLYRRIEKMRRVLETEFED
jgi:hypothetical protein